MFREHSGPVFSVAFSPDDKWIASGSADRTTKIWDLASGARLYTLSEPTDAVQTVAFAPSGGLLSAAGNDRTIRTWTLIPQGGTQVRATVAHAAPILRIAYSPDGTLLASSGADRRIKMWHAATGAQVRTIEAQSDWATPRPRCVSCSARCSSRSSSFRKEVGRVAIGGEDETFAVIRRIEKARLDLWVVVGVECFRQQGPGLTLGLVAR